MSKKGDALWGGPVVVMGNGKRFRYRTGDYGRVLDSGVLEICRDGEFSGPLSSYMDGPPRVRVALYGPGAWDVAFFEDADALLGDQEDGGPLGGVLKAGDKLVEFEDSEAAFRVVRIMYDFHRVRIRSDGDGPRKDRVVSLDVALRMRDRYLSEMRGEVA